MSDPFIEAIKDRYPLQTGYGSAASEDMKKRMIGIRPDIALDWKLYLLAFLCLDHFYVRSPYTGVAKVLTAGGLGIWWAWDLFQLFFEKERVIRYGMTTPGDFITGIAQGMITDKTYYSQRMPSIITALGSVFGFLGFMHMSAGQMTAGLRILFIQCMTILCITISWYYSTSKWAGLTGFLSVFFGLGSIAIIWLWILNMFGYTEGNSVKSVTDSLNYFSEYDFTGFLTDVQKNDLKILSVDNKILATNLIIEHITEKKKADAVAGKKPFPLLALPLTVIAMIKSLVGMIWAMTPMGRATAAATAVTSAVTATAAAPALQPRPLEPKPISQHGGSQDEMSVESQILGATVIAILGGGLVKAFVS